MYVRTNKRREVKQKFEDAQRAMIEYFRSGGSLYIHKGFKDPEVGERVNKEDVRDIRPEITAEQVSHSPAYISDLRQLDDQFNEKKREGILSFLEDNGLRLTTTLRLYLKSEQNIPGLTDKDMEVLRGEFLEQDLPDFSEVRGVGEETAEVLDLFFMNCAVEDESDALEVLEGDEHSVLDVPNVGTSVRERLMFFLRGDDGSN